MIQRVGPLIFAPLLGIVAMILPVIVRPPGRWYDSPLFPILRTAVERVGPGQFLLLFLAGLFLGAVSGRRPILLGQLTVALLPAAAVAEMFADPTSHNLWPLEFVVYGFYGCVVAAGAALAHRFGRGRKTEALRGAGIST